MSWYGQHEALAGGGPDVVASLRPPLGLQCSAWFETLCRWREPVHQLTRLQWRHLWNVENHLNGMSFWQAKKLAKEMEK